MPSLKSGRPARLLAALTAATTAWALWSTTAHAAPSPDPSTPSETSAASATGSPIASEPSSAPQSTAEATATPSSTTQPSSTVPATSTPATAEPTVTAPATTEPTSAKTTPAGPLAAPRVGRVHRPLTPTNTTEPRFSTAASALSDINQARSKVGAAPLVSDSTLSSALGAHARYLEANKNDPNLNPNTEVPGKPGYTSAGAAIAPWTLVAAGVGNHNAAVSLWLMDPWERSARLLHPLTQGIAITSTATYVVAAVNFKNTANQEWPQVYPGTQHNEGVFNSTAASYYAGPCSTKSSSWGYPITVQFDHQTLGALSNVRTSLYRDGVPVAHCVLSNSTHLDMDAQVVLLPLAPLVAGSHYSGGVSATATKKAGGTTTVNGSINITMRANNSVWGDQTGDGIGDLLVTDANGMLRTYKGRAVGKISSNWVTGHGWSSFTWFSRVPDVTGDRREDLIARRGDGTMWLYNGDSMGAFSGGRQVGKGWNGIRAIAIMGNIVGDANPELVAVSTKDNALLRYTVTSRGITGTSVIGKNWGAIKQTLTVGSFNADGTNDLLAITTSGDLRAYYFNTNGLPAGTRRVGGGWGGFTAVIGTADTTGDKRRDLVGRDAAGLLWTYPNKGNNFGSRIQTGKGWGGIKIFG